VRTFVGSGISVALGRMDNSNYRLSNCVLQTKFQEWPQRITKKQSPHNGYDIPLINN
jgi:hypothetical protein